MPTLFISERGAVSAASRLYPDLTVRHIRAKYHVQKCPDTMEIERGYVAQITMPCVGTFLLGADPEH